ncbi:MAG: RagB/SusD family nutrient uptake outer membrane protein [Bacteroidales bacterium]
MRLLKYFIVISITLLIVSCDDFLDQKPSKSTSLVPTTVEQLEYLLNNYSNFYQEGNRTAVYSTDDYGLQKELFDAKSSAYGVVAAQFGTWDTEFLPFDTRENFWSGEYRKIFTANMVLNTLSNVSGSETQKENLRLEAHFVRAYSYWTLAQTYCLPYNEANKDEVGLVLKNSTSFEEPVERATLKATYEQIEVDLTEALKLTTKLEMVNNKYKSWRASKAAVNAFAARYYLNRNDYTKALNYANTALQEHSVMMDYNVDMRYSSIISNVTVGGVATRIWYPYTHDNQSDFTDMMEWKEQYYFRMLYHESWWYIPSTQLLALYDKTNDLRYKYHMVKNYSFDRGLTSPAYEYPGYIFFFKDRIPSGPTVAEMHLIKAECLARQNKVTEALSAVNVLRAKRMDKNAPMNTINLSASSKDEAIARILEERRREMPFTQRWNDIRRLNNNEDSNDDVGSITRSFYGFSSATISASLGLKTYTLPKNSRRYAAPIPNTEILSSNGVIKQNTY